MGDYNGDKTNDLMKADGTTIDITSSESVIFAFGNTCKTSDTSIARHKL